MTDIGAMIGELMSLTPGGLPYPESTEDINQGANAIKSLALALESRGGGKLVQAGQTSVTFTNADGILTFPTPFKAGTVPRLLGGGGDGANAGNAILLVAFNNATNTNTHLNAVKVSGVGAASAWVTGGTAMNIQWIAIGTAP